ncbi:MAG: hypothetical protein AVDCRST_MAG19-1899 [uncultured Thermomicrobiales bacterium]|uniref:Uncharacterized protein n=1 Tax=uncultured Thermomicrobiales bacterium TaxID=1645740 RepID=A0A6J4V1F4_9BACT|nr:MAG: hypothetical protein AVDCRST_MAG19-1899 [uncultured Thermomicrobiales bacterium]
MNRFERVPRPRGTGADPHHSVQRTTGLRTVADAELLSTTPRRWRF